MALYHFHVSRVLRSRGQSCVEAAAYRAGERLEDSYYGKIADYTAKGGVICSEILTPDYVPESFHNREYLWNAVEETEKHPKAQLAYSFDFALQNEFSMEENIALARRFVLENFVAKGMIADMAVYDPDKHGGIPNPHVHVLCPIRPMNEDGTWGGGSGVRLTPEERQQAKIMAVEAKIARDTAEIECINKVLLRLERLTCEEDIAFIK